MMPLIAFFYAGIVDIPQVASKEALAACIEFKIDVWIVLQS